MECMAAKYNKSVDICYRDVVNFLKSYTGEQQDNPINCKCQHLSWFTNKQTFYSCYKRLIGNKRAFFSRKFSSWVARGGANYTVGRCSRPFQGSNLSSLHQSERPLYTKHDITDVVQNWRYRLCLCN